MGTVGHNAARDNWFFSDGSLDNQAWDNAIAVAATGRITQLTAYMAGDLGAIHGGPALWDAAGNLILYSEQPIARRSPPYSGGFDGTGRNQNDGYYINVYGFNHTFTDPTSFIVGAFRRSGDSWILGFNDHESNYGHLKTVGGSSPGTATGGSSWLSQSGFNGGVQAYATYVPLGLFSRVGGTFVPVTLKRFFDSVTTYFATIMADTPLRYFRNDEATGGPYIDHGSYGRDGANVNGGPTADIAGLITDTDHATRFAAGGGGFKADAGGGPADTYGFEAPIDQSFEFWIKVRSAGWDNPGAGGVGPVMGTQTSDPGYGGFVGIIAGSTGSHFSVDDGIHMGDEIRVILSNAFFGAGLETGFDISKTNAMTGGYNFRHHVVVTYNSGGWGGGAGFSVGTGTLKIYVDGVLFSTDTVDGFQPWMLGWAAAGGNFQFYVGTDLQASNRDFDIDETAWYGYVLSATQVAHHYSVGTGGLGGITSTGAQLFLRNDANTAWIALNMAALRQEMPERREFPGRIVYPDGRWEDILMRWGEPETFGFTKGDWQRAHSGLVVPRQFARA